jgi:hypothetical protein
VKQGQLPMRVNRRRDISRAGSKQSLGVVLATWIIIALTSGVLIAGLITAVSHRLPLSLIDEHVHLDYALAIHDGDLPFRGSIYSKGVIKEWSCGVGHEAGFLPFPCGSPKVNASILPSGRYSSAYSHYPTYFVAGDVWRRAFQAVIDESHALTIYRYFSVACLVAGLVVGVTLSRRVLRFQGAKLVAAAFIPIAAAIVVYLGTKLNPSSTAVLSGVLIAAAGIRWVSSGRGFGLLMAASAAAAITAITDSLPAGAFVLLIALALVAKRFGWKMAGPWEPRWTHLGALTAVLVLPVVLWGEFISARATVGNEPLYGRGRDVSVVIRGTFLELSSLHSPWYDADSVPSGTGTLLRSFRSLAAGLQGWIGVLVFGALGLIVLLAIRTSHRPVSSSNGSEVVVVVAEQPTAHPAHASSAWDTADSASSDTVKPREVDPLYLLAACALAGFILYPPALYVSNALNFGGQTAIVSRYSASFMPLLTYLVLLLVPGRWLPRVLAVMGVVTVVGLAVSWF